MKKNKKKRVRRFQREDAERTKEQQALDHKSSEQRANESKVMEEGRQAFVAQCEALDCTADIFTPKESFAKLLPLLSLPALSSVCDGQRGNDAGSNRSSFDIDNACNDSDMDEEENGWVPDGFDPNNYVIAFDFDQTLSLTRYQSSSFHKDHYLRGEFESYRALTLLHKLKVRNIFTPHAIRV